MEEEKPLTCDLCHREIILETPDDGTVAISPDGGTWNVCGACRSSLVATFPPPHSYEPPAEKEREYDDNGDLILESDDEEADPLDA